MAYLLSVRLNDPQQPGIMWGDRLVFSLPVKLVRGWLAILFSIALASMASPAAQADDLQDYAQQCDAAIGATVQEFDCDAGTEVLGQGGAPFGTNASCDEPNRLDKQCDPGSHFQVLTRTEDAYVVAHCRKKGNQAGEYGDIAVIQHSRKNGATCFYQAFGTLPGQVKAPSKGQATYPWFTPSSTANVGCGGCHDNGPFIRSPYINQVKDSNALPGSNDISFNRDQPYAFVGKDFAAWKAFKVEIAKNECNTCHRLGVNDTPVHTFPCSPGHQCGTALDFAERATSSDEKSEEDMRDAHKNPPSAASPIWMPPFPIQTSPNPIHANSAKAIHDCALRFHEALGAGAQLPDNDECRITQFAGAYLTDAVVVVNGAMQSPSTPGRSEGGGDLSACSNGGSCPLGFCYFGTLHGPFWQSSPSTIPTGDFAYRGSLIRIYGEGGKWKYRWLADLGGPPTPPPGGTMFCTPFNEIVAVPDPTKCFASPFSVFDPDGTHSSQSVDATVTGSTVNVLSGFIGNVAQSNIEVNKMQVVKSGARVTLVQSHSEHDPLPNQLGPKLGPLKGESWTNGCDAWTPDYEASDTFSTSDVQLVSPAQSENARCFITGIAGAWSSTRNDGTKQPFAEIFKGPTNDIRLRVFPANQADRVGAFASCIRVK
jgi:hypothetical protein